MISYILDFALVFLLIIALTATIGVITNSIGIKFFSRGQKDEFTSQNNKTLANFKLVSKNK